MTRTTKNYKSLPYNPALRARAKELRKAGILHEVLLKNHPALTGTPPVEGNNTTLSPDENNSPSRGAEKKFPSFGGVAGEA